MKKDKILPAISVGLCILTVGGVLGSLFTKTAVDSVHTCDILDRICYNSTSHYYVCTYNDCDKKFQEEKHVFNWVIDKEETFEENGIKHEACKCGYKRNLNTIIDDVYNPEHITLKNDLNRIDIVNTWLDGSGTMSPEFSVGSLINSNSNVSFTSRYQLATETNIGYEYSNIHDTRIYYTTPGFAIYNSNGNVFKIMLRIYPQHENKYSLDIASDLGRYRLISNDVNALCEDFINSGYVDIDFGVYEVKNLGNVYGIRFKTANKELTYVSDNSGTIKNETEFFKCADLDSVTGEPITIKEALGWIETDGIYNKDRYAILLRSTQMSGNSVYGSLITCKDASNWLIEKVKYLTWLNK